MDIHTFQPGAVHLFRLPAGSDIVEEITSFAADRGIEAAWVSFLGAVRRAAVRYYDQGALAYEDLDLDQPLEVLAGVGNITMLDGAQFLHAHAVFSDDEGRAFGGHLTTGCEVFSLEVRVEELVGAAPHRAFDEDTGLALWQAPV